MTRSGNIIKILLLLIVGGLASPLASQDTALLKQMLSTMESFSSFRATITINNTINGQLSYKRPNLLHVKFSDGRIISANGRFLWFYSPAKAIAGKQDLDGSTSGLNGLLGGYENVSVTGNTIHLKSTSRYYQEITVVVDEQKRLKALRLKKPDQEYTNISFSGVQVNIGLPSNLFNLHPPSSAQIIENPLNQKE